MAVPTSNINVAVNLSGLSQTATANVTSVTDEKVVGVAVVQGPKGDPGDPATNLVTSVAGRIGAVTLTKSDVGLSNVDNTSDVNKPVSTATQTAIDAKVVDSIADADTTHAPSRNAVFDALALKQPLDSDLTDIAALTPSNDDVVQRKAGAWTNRTPSQLKTDLALVKGDVGLGNVDNTSDATKNSAVATVTNKDLTSGTNTFPTFNQNTTGSAAKWTTARNLAGNSVDGSANVAFANKFIVQGTSDSGLSDAQFLGSLATGLVKNTATTGVLSIATSGTDYYAPGSTDVAIADGGTGASTKAAAFDALSPMTTSGDIIYGGASGTGTRLAKGTDGQVLTLASGLPTWATGGGGSGDMVLASAQTVTGAKTFNAGTLLDKGSMVFSAKAFLAIGDDSTDDTTALQNMIAAAATAHGRAQLEAGKVYKITSALKLYTGTTPTITAYTNFTLDLNGATIKQYTTGADVIKGINDVANGAQTLNVTIQDGRVLFGGATLTNSGNGIYLSQQAAGGPSYQQMYIKNVVAENIQGSGKYGFNGESIIVSTFDACMAVSCANGFNLNGAVGGAYNSVSTSVTFLNCYANMATNGQIGYNILDNTYISLVGCACDIGANNSASAYLVDGSNCVTFTGCGVELNGTATLGNGIKIQGGSSQIGIYQQYFYQSKTMVDIYVTGTSTGVTIVGAQDNSSVSGSTGLKVDAGSAVTEVDNNWGAVATPRSINATGVDTILSNSAGGLTTKIANLTTSAVFSGSTSGTTTVQATAAAGSTTLTLPAATDTLVGKATSDTLTNKRITSRIGTTASSSTPTPDGNANDQYNVTALAANATFGAPTGTLTDGQTLIIRIKDNGTARTLAWNAIYRAVGVTLPTTTVISKTLYLGMKYNVADTKWDVIAVAQEA